MISILVPIKDIEVAEKFYVNLIGFIKEDYSCYMYDSFRKIELLFQKIGTEEYYKYPYLKEELIRFPMFRFYIESDFLTYIQRLTENNVKIINMISHPGGYYAQIQDPFYNTFEILSEKFEDKNQNSINPMNWDFYKRL